jgi:predicted DCC family thiol-disulfide oxidoreductase YuxK
VRERAVLVLYDADCGLCGRLASWLGQHGTRVAPIHSTVGDRELRDLSQRRREGSVHAVDGDGRRRSGADALPSILRALPHLGRAARVVEAAPGPVRVGYAIVTRNRRGLSRLLGLQACASREARR